MPIGPGKYDAEAMAVLARTGADGVVLLVAGGNKGSGFSVTTSDKRFIRAVPRLLRQMADGIDKDLEEAEL